MFRTIQRSLAVGAVFTLFLFPNRSWATPPAGYVLTWSDEFGGNPGDPPNPANWGYDTTNNSGWGNNELENYTTSTANSQIVTDPTDTNPTDGSYLAIIAIDTTPGNPAYSTVNRYTSARLDGSGKQSFQYGWMEARIKSPTGQGLWPAFWMLGTNIGTVGWPACGETDIMEQVGNPGYQNINYGSLHSPNYNSSNNIYTLSSPPYFNAAYHTYAVNWQQDQVQFYVDNNLYETEIAANIQAAGGTWAFNHPFFFLLNQAVGGSFPGTPNASTSFPQTFFVDYVRVYEPATPTPTPTKTPTVTFTPTLTPTPCASCPPTATSTASINSLYPIVYPNPSTGRPVQIHIPGRTVVSDVKVQLFTLGFRKVLDQTFPQVLPTTDVTIPMVDVNQVPLSNGVYYVVVTSSEGKSIIKLLVLR